MLQKADKVYIGLLLGIVAPFIGFFAFYMITYSHLSIGSFIKKMILAHVYTPLISLCVISNLPVFFTFIYSDKYYGARGVLLATFIYAGLVVFLKYFT